MTVTVNFEDPQVRPENGQNGIEISQVVIPYSIHNTEDASQYLGGQTVLTKEDGVAFTDNTKDWERLGLAKIKNMVADAEIYVPDPIIEVPASSADNSVASSEATVVSSATVAPVSSAAPAISASTVASSAVEAPVSSASVVASSASAQVTTTPSESTTEA